jgi:hypothetical protein
LVLDQASVDEPPGATVAGFAERVAVAGGGATVTVALAGSLVPPGPVQVSV